MLSKDVLLYEYLPNVLFFDYSNDEGSYYSFLFYRRDAKIWEENSHSLGAKVMIKGYVWLYCDLGVDWFYSDLTGRALWLHCLLPDMMIVPLLRVCRSPLLREQIYLIFYYNFFIKCWAYYPLVCIFVGTIVGSVIAY